jgi:hypothetical protein
VRLAEIPALEIISSNEATTSAGKYCSSASRASWRTNLFQRESHGGEPGALFLKCSLQPPMPRSINAVGEHKIVF